MRPRLGLEILSFFASFMHSKRKALFNSGRHISVSNECTAGPLSPRDKKTLGPPLPARTNLPETYLGRQARQNTACDITTALQIIDAFSL
jgi:hypothetical protein